MRLRKIGVCTAALSLAAVSLAGAGVMAPTAAALTAPVAMTADELPTWQTNGIVWAMAQADGVVFAGGTFSSVRPPGAALSTDEKPAVNFVALDAATGEPTSCELSFTVGDGLATVRALKVSPDGKTLYAGGRFGTVNGVKVSNVAAIDIASCTPRSDFKPSVSATVRALAVTGDDVYLGGDFTTVEGKARRYFASVTSSGALRSWTADADKPGRAVEATPDGKNVILGGDFFTVRGANSHALAVVDSTSGALTKGYPLGFLPARTVVKDIVTDATGFYTAQEGNPVEGRIAFNLSDFNQRWRDTCVGATQAVEVYKGVLYSGSHAHRCDGAGGFTNRERQHLLAQSVHGPALLGWFPDTNDGLGEKIGPRVLATASRDGTDYLWVGGEFTTVNGEPQQGLTRFASGPDTGAPPTPQVSVSSTRPGTVDVRWQASLDLDDSRLTYRVYRDGSDNPVHTVSGSSSLGKRPQLTFTDTGVTPGSTHTYRITASDGVNTSARSASVKVTVAATADRYAQRIIADGANLYWRFEEADGTFAADSSGKNNNGVHKNGPTRGLTPGMAGSRAGIGYLGDDEYTYSDTVTWRPAAYSIETWFKTTTKTGGKLIGFGPLQEQLDIPAGRFAKDDKHIYMDNRGRLVFGVNTDRKISYISTRQSFNNGAWHHVVATQGRDGTRLYVDGKLQTKPNRVTFSQNYVGSWHVGGGRMGTNWPQRPSSVFFNGEIDETAVYPKVLTPAQISQHRRLGSFLARHAPAGQIGIASQKVPPSLTNAPAAGAEETVTGDKEATTGLWEALFYEAACVQRIPPFKCE
ncbi:hypothetical protein ABIE67_010172 [Streptomyces sp. V4I8]|uniref:LamG-like jellyroll fold domain-containing protein n=1 Tax=Streptomyces sp. V4I8 TaxID=3156469 RepID=UPI0035121EEE